MSYKFLSTIQAISATFTGNSVYSNSTPNRTVKVDATGLYLSRTSDGAYPSSITANGSMYYDTRNSHIFRNDGTASMTLFDNTRNVGIGTSTDSGYKLDVNGTTRIQGATRISTSSALNSTQFLTIDVTSSGNIIPGSSVGLGIGISGTYTDNNSSNNTIYNPFINVNAGISTSYNLSGVSRTFINFSPFVSNAGSDLNNSTYVLGISPSFTSRHVNNITGIYYNPTFTLTGNNNNHRAIHTVTGDVLFGTTSGVVGIGTTTPSYTLDVNGNLRAITSGIVGNAAAFSGGFGGLMSVRKDLDITAGGTYRNAQLAVGSTTNNGALLLGYSTTGIGSIQAAVMGVSYSSLSIQGFGGNLMVGTTTDAGYKLDVNGTFRVQYGTVERGAIFTHSNGTYAEIVLGNGSAAGVGVVEIHRNGTSAISLRSTAVLFNTSRLVTPSTFFVTGPYGGSSIGTSVRLASNTVDQGVYTATSGTQNTVVIGNSGNEIWQPSSGNATYNLFSVLPSINTSGTYAGIVRGFYYSPTLTSITGVTHRAIETVTGDVIFGSTSGNTLIGTTTNSGAKLTVAGSVTAATALARGIYFNNTLVAAANNDVLVGLDVNPTFTNGAFTGVSNWGIRSQARVFINPTIATTNSLLRLTDNTNGTAWMGFSTVVATGFFIGANGSVTLGQGVSGDNSAPTGAFVNLRSSSGSRITLNTNSAAEGIIFSDNYNATIRMQFPSANEAAITTITSHNLSIGTSTGAASAVTNTLKFFQSTGNVFIGSSPTDAGYKLDVNGTARVTGAITTGITGTAGTLNLNRSSDGANVGFVRAESSGAGIQIGSGVNMFFSNNGRIVVNSTTTDASAIFKIDSSTQGFLPPRMTSAQRTAISTPAVGLIVYQTDSVEGVYVYTSGGWKSLTMV